VVTYDVAVVGGSVAGAVTARECARRGLRVALFEKSAFPRLKPCGEGLLPQGVAALRSMGLEPRGVPVRGLRYVAPSGATAEADFPNGARGLVVRRDRFDAALFAAAAATPGVDAFPRTEWTPGKVESRWIVGADGLRSQFHRRPEFPASPPSLRRVGLSTHAAGLEVDRERVEVILHERGEVYLAPSEDGDALVACLFRADELPEGASAEDSVLELLLSLDVLRGRTRGLSFTTPVLACAPLGLRVGSVAEGDVLLVGDASGAPDPVTGEGMSLAILSAAALADALAAGEPERYAKEHRRLAANSEWLGRWLLRATRYPALADRVVAGLVEHPELFGKLVEIAVGARRPGDLSLVDVARLVV
jgi:flavin-dependent dehydrogenase